MKISELIVKLQAIQAEHGDIGVDAEGDGGTYEVRGVDVQAEWYHDRTTHTDCIVDHYVLLSDTP